jgi:TonB C terminal
MEDEEGIYVSEWQRPEASPLPTKSARRGLSPTVIGLISTLVFHVFLVKSLGIALGRVHLPVLPSTENYVGEADLTLLPLIAAPKAGDMALDGIPPLKLAISSNPLVLDAPVVKVERLTLDDQTTESGGPADPSLTLADEIYRGQIMARVERIWRRPRTPIDGGAQSFQCQAQLEQDERGNVREVLLPVCDGAEAWRNSLLTAIKQASPLPAPPDARVFRSSLVLHFVGLLYSIARSDDGYQ